MADMTLADKDDFSMSADDLTRAILVSSNDKFAQDFEAEVWSRSGWQSWQPFVRGKNRHENFRLAYIYNFRDKCVIFACNRKFANLTH